MRTVPRAMALAASCAALVAVVAAPAGGSVTAARTASGCASRPARVGRIGGIMAPGSDRPRTDRACAPAAPSAQGRTPPASPYNNTPPLTYNGGPVMGTAGAVTVTPVYWSPTGTTIPSAYRQLTTQFVDDVAAASGAQTNVFSNLTQYTDASSDPIQYDVTAGTPVVDTDSFPTSGGCTPDTGEVYADASGYSKCVTDAQIETELTSVLSAHSLPSDLAHLYLMFLPKGVESCFGSTNNTDGGQCTISAQGGTFCGYHSSFGPSDAPTIYADLPFAIEDSPISGFTCSSDAGVLTGDVGVGNQSPNGDLDADTVLSVTSHEMNESITDPFLSAWFDSTGNEIGDDCAYIYGDSSSFQGAGGAEYNQTINGDHYFIQEEFSNQEFAVNPADSCVQQARAQTVQITSTPPATPTVSGTYDVTAAATSSLPVTLSIDPSSTSVCSIIGAQVTFNDTGACLIDANQPGSTSFVPAAQVQQTVDIGSFDGSGTFSASTPSVLAGSTGNTLTFTYTAAGSGPSSGHLDVTVPGSRGWSVPTTATGGQGEVTATCGSVVVVGDTIEMSGMTLSGGATCTVTYGATTSGGTGASAPATPGSDTFTTEEAQTAGGTLTDVATSPSIAVDPAADGSGALELPTPSSLAVGATGTTLTFTYQSAVGGTNGGTLSVQVPAGWTAPSTTLGHAGYVTSSCGTVGVLGMTIDVTAVSLRSVGTCNLVYGSTVGSAPGATAGVTLGTATFATEEKSSAAGTLTELAASPSLTLGQASSTTAVTVSPASVPYGHEQAVHLVVRVRGVGSTVVATGTVTVMHGSTTVCTPTLSGGAARCDVSPAALPVGRSQLVASYGGSAAVAGSTSRAAALTVTKEPSHARLVLSTSTVHLGHEQVARLVVRVSAQFPGTALVGRVEVRAGGRVLCAAALDHGAATCTLGARELAKGAHLVSATFAGDAVARPSASNKVRVTVT